MDIHIQSDGPATLIEVMGQLDGTLSPPQRDQLLTSASGGRPLILDLSRPRGMSGSGLRMLLLFCRHVWASGGAISLRAVAPELRGLADAAGFGWLLRQGPASARRPVAPASRRPAIDAYPTHHHAGFALRPGFPIPFGSTLTGRGINFSVFSRYATGCTLVLFEPDGAEPVAEIPFPAEFRVGDVYAMTVFDLDYENIE